MNSLQAGSAGGPGLVNSIIYVLLSFVLVYFVYRLVYPQQDPREAQVLDFNDGGRAITASTDLNAAPLPQLFTGGEMTLSFWLYVSDWDVRAGMVKHVLSVRGSSPGTNYNSLVCALYPQENKMMIRVRTAGASSPTGMGSQSNPTSPQGSGSSDYTNIATFNNLLNQNIGLADFTNTLNYPMCDLPEFDLQRWINVTVVVSGRVCDVYLDGKLARSCMLDNVIQFPKSVGSAGIAVDACQKQGFGGALSRVQLYSYAITPDRVYGIYQAGPSIKSATLVDKLLGLFGINLTVSAYKVTSPQQSCNGSMNVNVPSIVGTSLTGAGLTTSGALGGALSNPVAAAQ